MSLRVGKIYLPDIVLKKLTVSCDDEIEETFEIAEPNKHFAIYSKVKFVRQK